MRALGARRNAMDVSVLCIPADHPSLPGHFPGRPVVPGVVILDHAAARARTLLGVPHGPRRIAQVKFLAPLLPAQEALLELDEDTARQRVRFRLLRDGALLAAGELAFAP